MFWKHYDNRSQHAQRLGLCRTATQTLSSLGGNSSSPGGKAGASGPRRPRPEAAPRGHLPQETQRTAELHRARCPRRRAAGPGPGSDRATIATPGQPAGPRERRAHAPPPPLPAPPLAVSLGTQGRLRARMRRAAPAAARGRRMRPSPGDPARVPRRGGLGTAADGGGEPNGNRKRKRRAQLNRFSPPPGGLSGAARACGLGPLAQPQPQPRPRPVPPACPPAGRQRASGRQPREGIPPSAPPPSLRGGAAGPSSPRPPASLLGGRDVWQGVHVGSQKRRLGWSEGLCGQGRRRRRRGPAVGEAALRIEEGGMARSPPWGPPVGSQPDGAGGGDGRGGGNRDPPGFGLLVNFERWWGSRRLGTLSLPLLAALSVLGLPLHSPPCAPPAPQSTLVHSGEVVICQYVKLSGLTANILVLPHWSCVCMHMCGLGLVILPLCLRAHP